MTDDFKVLVAEDEMLIALEVAQTLEREGVQVIGPCTTVSECLEAIAHEKVDAAILDVELKDELVFPAAKQLKEKAIPIVFHTGR